MSRFFARLLVLSMLIALGPIGPIRAGEPVPFQEPFMTNAFPSYWAVYQVGVGSTATIATVTGDRAPYQAALTVNSGGAAEITVALDLAERPRAWLSFWRTSGSATPPPPSVFTNHASGDGVAVSVDNTVWFTLAGMNTTNWVAASGGMGQVMLPLAELLQARGLSLTNQVWLRFQRTSTYGTTHLDNITVVEPEVENGFTENFESNALNPSAWTVYCSKGAGVNSVAPGASVSGGGYQFRMGGPASGASYQLNELTLHYRYRGEFFPVISFWQREAADDDHPMPEVFTNQVNADGLAVSLDGVVWRKLHGLLTPNQSYAGTPFFSYSFGLAPVLQQLGAVSGSLVRIKFQQYDDQSYSDGGYDYPGYDFRDGFAFDQIWLGFPAAVPPWVATFEGGDVGTFALASAGAARIAASTGSVPRSGSFHLLMDGTTNGAPGSNEALLRVDAQGQTNLVLSFWHKSLSDEPSPLPATFSTNAPGDGVAASLDGSSWIRLTDLAASYDEPGTYHAYSIGLAGLFPGLGSAERNLWLSFRQADDYSAPWDGGAFDNIAIYNHGPAADLSVRFLPPGFSLAQTGSNWTYRFVISNSGPDRATGIVVTNAIPVAAVVASVTPGQGTHAVSAGRITFSAGDLAAGQAVTSVVTLAVNATGVAALALSATNEVMELYAGDDRAALNMTINHGGSLVFATNAYSVREGADFVTITVARTGGTAGVVTCLVSTADGSALANEDYAVSNAVLLLGNGTTNASLTLVIRNDSAGESNETFTINLRSYSGGIPAGAVTTAVITIADDDNEAAALPFFDNLESGTMGPWWSVYSNSAQAILVSNAAPPTGRWMLSMETVTYGGQVDATVRVVSGGDTDLFFGCRRRVKPWEDVDPDPSVYTNHVNADGLSISTDGIVWRSVVPSVSAALSASGDVSVVAGLAASLALLPPATDGSVWVRVQSHPDFFSPSLNGWLYDNVWVARREETADLTGSIEPLHVPPGEPVSFALVITNDGPAAATGILAVATLPAAFVYSNATSPAGSCVFTDRQVRFSLPSLEARESATATISGLFATAGVFSIRAVIFPESPDRQPSNDAFAASSVVSPSSAVSAVLPFVETFETNQLGPWWQLDGVGPARAQVTTALLPHNGSRHYVMDAAGLTQSALNELSLQLETGVQTNLFLSWRAKSIGDDPHPLPADFAQRAFGDGVAISADGAVWHTVASIDEATNGLSWCSGGAIPQVHRYYQYSLDALKEQSGQLFTGRVYVRFQQYGNLAAAGSSVGCNSTSSFPTNTQDGIAWDTIRVAPPPPIVIVNAGPTSGVEMVPFQATLIFTNGLAPYTSSALTELPSGLRLTNNIIAGTPLQSGITSVQLAITDADGWGRTQAVQITISSNANQEPVVIRVSPWANNLVTGEHTTNVMVVDVSDPEGQPLAIRWLFDGRVVATNSTNILFHVGWSGGGTNLPANTTSRLVLAASDGLWTNSSIYWQTIILTDDDGDGMPNTWELAHDLDPLADDDSFDPDDDGLTNLGEYQNGTDPHLADSNADSIPDNWSLEAAINPTNLLRPIPDRMVQSWTNSSSMYEPQALQIRSNYLYLLQIGTLRTYDIAGATPTNIAATYFSSFSPVSGLGLRDQNLFAGGSSISGYFSGAVPQPNLFWYALTNAAQPLMSGSSASYSSTSSRNVPADLHAGPRYILYPCGDSRGMLGITIADLPSSAIVASSTLSLTNGLLATNSLNTFCVSTGHLYIAGAGILASYRLNHGAAPEGPILTAITGTAHQLVFWSNRLAAATTRGLQLFDLADPDRPQFLSSLEDLSALGLDIVGQLAHVVGSNIYEIVDLSDPVHPVRAARRRVPNITGVSTVLFRVAATTNRAYAISGSPGVSHFSGWLYCFTDFGRIDGDGDGMLDAWEGEHLGTLATGPGDDPDGDGISNAGEYLAGLLPESVDSDGDGVRDRDEFIAGTSPTDASSLFVLFPPVVRSDGTNAAAILSWPSATNRRYHVEGTTNLVDGFTPFATNLAATPPLNSYTNLAPVPAAYRVRVGP